MKLFRFKNILLTIAITAGFAIFASIAATAAPLGASIGSVHESIGETFASRVVGVNYEKNVGDLVGAGEVLSTGKNSSMTVKFMDATTMTLGSNAEVEIDELVYDPDANANDNSLIISLSQGTYYYASGHIKKENITILTPTATIGIRGTELAIKIDSDGATSVGVIKGAAIMRARNRDRDTDRASNTTTGRSVFIDIGSTGRIEKSGELSTPFGGIDLTGDDEVDRKIPGVASWIDNEDSDGVEIASRDHDEGMEIDDHRGGEYNDEYVITERESDDNDAADNSKSDDSDDNSDDNSGSDENDGGDDSSDDGGDDGDDDGGSDDDNSGHDSERSSNDRDKSERHDD